VLCCVLGNIGRFAQKGNTILNYKEKIVAKWCTRHNFSNAWLSCFKLKDQRKSNHHITDC
jgi:hypothetical protein